MASKAEELCGRAREGARVGGKGRGRGEGATVTGQGGLQLNEAREGAPL